MSGRRWTELEVSRVRIREAVQQRLREETCVYGPMLVRLEMADPELLIALGGKAGNLARVKNQLGLPVPDGVVATLAAYRVFLAQEMPGQEGTLLARIKARLAALDLTDPVAVAAASRDIRAMVLAQPIPEDLQQGLLTESRRLAAAGPEAWLTVRSSGGREDLGATFAGQYESFLGVAPAEVPQRWRQVVASQFGERAMIYFKLQGLLPEEAAMGVLVQRLIEARAAGVMFTTDPEGCDPDRLLVSATLGLAADLVSGLVSADEFIVSKKTGRLLHASLGRKEYCLAVRDGRLTRLPLPPELAAAPALQEGDLEQLAGMARLLEGYYRRPQGVEWAQDRDGRLYVIQSRHLQTREAESCRHRAEEPLAGGELLLEEGRTGAPGVAAGPVFHLVRRRQPSPGAPRRGSGGPSHHAATGSGAAPAGGHRHRGGFGHGASGPGGSGIRDSSPGGRPRGQIFARRRGGDRGRRPRPGVSGSDGGVAAPASPPHPQGAPAGPGEIAGGAGPHHSLNPGGPPQP